MFLDTVNYRDLSFPLFQDEEVIYTIIAGKRFDLKCNLTNYRKYVEEEIDKFLDNLESYKISEEVVLEEFNNAGHKDFRLKYNGRTIFIYLTRENDEISAISIIEDAKQRADKYKHSI